jgi:cell division protein FtsQ
MKMGILKFLKLSGLTMLLVAAGWGGHAVWRHLRTAPRFEATRIVPRGMKHLTEGQIAAAALPVVDEGVNVFALDLEAIRMRVEALTWVRHAVVARVLPNQVSVKVIEREPIGLARVGGEIRQFDAEGVILDAPGPGDIGDLDFPVLDELRPGDPEGNRRRAGIYKKTFDALLTAKGLSEIRIDDARGDVLVVPNFDLILVNLGTEDLLGRWNSFVKLRSAIRQLYPDAAMVDLRFRNQVIVRMTAGGAAGGRSVRWGVAKKNAL